MKTNQTKNIIAYKLSKVLLIIVIFFSSCKKDYLKPDPTSFLEPGATFSTRSGLDAAMAICDRHLRSYWTYLEVTQLSLPISTEYMFSDVAVAGKTDDGGIFTDIATRLTPTEMPERVPYFWNETYNGIRYANTIVSYVDKVESLDSATKNEYLGRAFFHRLRIVAGGKPNGRERPQQQIDACLPKARAPWRNFRPVGRRVSG